MDDSDQKALIESVYVVENIARQIDLRIPATEELFPGTVDGLRFIVDELRRVGYELRGVAGVLRVVPTLYFDRIEEAVDSAQEHMLEEAADLLRRAMSLRGQLPDQEIKPALVRAAELHALAASPLTVESVAEYAQRAAQLKAMLRTLWTHDG